MRGLTRPLIFVLLFIVLSTYCSFAGLIMERERYEEGSGQKSKAKIYIQDNKIKSTDEDGQFTIIFNLDTEEIIQVDNISRTYSSTKTDDYFSYYKSYALKLKAAMQQQLSELTPSEKARAEARMKQQGIEIAGANAGSMEISYKNTNDKKKIAGYESYKFEIYRNGSLNEEIWTSSDIRLQQEIDMNKMGKYMAELKKVEDSLGGMLLMNGESDDAYEKVYSSGFPMKTQYYPASGKTIVEKTVKVSKKDIDNSDFDAPSNYRKVSLEQMLQLGAQ